MYAIRSYYGHERRLESQGHEAVPEGRVFGQVAREVRVTGGVFGCGQRRQSSIHLRDFRHDEDLV